MVILLLNSFSTYPKRSRKRDFIVFRRARTPDGASTKMTFCRTRTITNVLKYLTDTSLTQIMDKKYARIKALKIVIEELKKVLDETDKKK